MSERKDKILTDKLTVAMQLEGSTRIMQKLFQDILNIRYEICNGTPGDYVASKKDFQVFMDRASELQDDVGLDAVISSFVKIEDDTIKAKPSMRSHRSHRHDSSDDETEYLDLK